MQKTKVCPKCGVEKDTNEFYKNKGRKDGLASWCKECCKKYREKNRIKIDIYNKEYREENKKELACKKKKYYNKNKEYIACKKKEYYIKNKEDILIKRSKYYSKNKSKVSSRKKRWLNKHVPYKSYISELNYCEEIQNVNGILEVKCSYCGRFFKPTRREVYDRLAALAGKVSKGAENRFYCSTYCKKACPIYCQRKNYKGKKVDGSSREVQPELRQMALIRDNFTCQKCGATNVVLHCHHIKTVADDPIESADLDNVIIYCKECHKKVHQQEGCKYYELGAIKTC